MAWYQIGEDARCKGRPQGRGKRRCRVLLVVGAWFWLEGDKPLCPTCALSATVNEDATLDDLETRRAHLVKLAGRQSVEFELNYI